MKRVKLILIAIILLIVDNSIAPFISIFDVAPSFLFIFAVGYSFIYGKSEAVFMGVLTGLLQDIYFFNGFGVNLLINMLCCYVVALIGEGIWKERKIIPVVAVFVASVAKYLLVFIILYILGIKIGFTRGIFIAIYNSIVMFLTYKFGFKLSDKERNETTFRYSK